MSYFKDMQSAPGSLALGIDFGTSGCRAVAIDGDGQIQAKAAVPLPSSRRNAGAGRPRRPRTRSSLPAPWPIVAYSPLATRSLQGFAELLLLTPETVYQHGLRGRKFANDLAQAVPVGVGTEAVSLHPGGHRDRRQAGLGGKRQRGWSGWIVAGS